MTYWLKQYAQDGENAFDLNGHGYLIWIFFLWGGGQPFSSLPSLPKKLIWGTANFNTANFNKSSKFTLTVGNCEVLIALAILVFYHFFSENYYQSKEKYFDMTCFNQIQIMNSTINLVPLSPLYEWVVWNLTIAGNIYWHFQFI